MVLAETRRLSASYWYETEALLVVVALLTILVMLPTGS